MASPISLGALRGLVTELQVSSRDARPLVVGGVRELAAVLRRELGTDAKPGGVSAGDDPRGAAVFVYVLGEDPTDEDERALKRARRARVPIVAVAAGRLSDDVIIPFVLATDVVRIGAGEGFPVATIARVIAARLGEGAAPLASRVPVLRGAVCDALDLELRAAAAASLPPRSSSPAPTCPCSRSTQVRMVLRLEQAFGLDIDPRERAARARSPRSAAGFGFRAARPPAARPRSGSGVGCTRAPLRMRARARSARPRPMRFETGMPGGHGVRPLRSRGPELRAARLDRTQPLAEPRPGPGLDLAVARGRLTARRLEVLEPGVRLLDQQ